MKKITYFMLGTLIVSACSNYIDEDNEKVAQSISNNYPSVVCIQKNQIVKSSSQNSEESIYSQALQFSDNDQYLRWQERLKKSNKQEINTLNKQIGFISLQDILTRSDRELDIIGEKAANENEFRKLYEDFKKKFSNYLVFNTYDTFDLSAYIPSSDNEEILKYISGGCHKVVINNQIIDLNFDNDMNRIDKELYANEKTYTLTRANNPITVEDYNGNESLYPKNEFVVTVGKKKTTFSCKINNGKDITYHLGSQKKMWYGWKRDDNRDFYFVSNVDMDIANWSVLETHPLLYSYYMDIYYFMSDIHGGKITFKMGTVPTARPPMAIESIEGVVYVWTDMTVDKDNNGDTLYYIIGEGSPFPRQSDCPMMSINKAYPCKVDLKVK